MIAAGECVIRGQQRSTVMTTEETTEQPPVDDCLKERKWWCFLLSSIFTFLAGLLIVLLWRAFAFLCCRKEPEFAPNDPKQKEQKTSRQGKEFEGTFMTEAKDWAGELISGQTTTGRILVSFYFLPNRTFLLLLFFLFLRIFPCPIFAFFFIAVKRKERESRDEYVHVCIRVFEKRMIFN